MTQTTPFSEVTTTQVTQAAAGLASTFAVALLGVDGALVRVEVNITSALRRFVIVGLPDGVVREARERVRCAIENSGFAFPRSEVIVSLSPASLPKFGSGFDLGIAVAILAADGQLQSDLLAQHLLLGELTLEGAIKNAPGALQAADIAAQVGLKRVLLSRDAEPLLPLLDPEQIHFVDSLREACRYFDPAIINLAAESSLAPSRLSTKKQSSPVDFADVIGQEAAKRALEIAAAGGHNLLFIGPPGVGKSMLARRLPSILPPLTQADAREVARIYSAQGSALAQPFYQRPFRAPHHTTSYAGLLGGGTPPVAGDLSLAHHGVIFLDELPEFRRDVLEGLREPLEAKSVAVSRSQMRVEFPADALVIAAMNPCPCGYRGYGSNRCRCGDAAVNRYRNRVSGPLLDRFDLHLWLGALTAQELNGTPPTNPTLAMQERVQSARAAQLTRNGKIPGNVPGSGCVQLNSALDSQALRTIARPTPEALRVLEEAYGKLRLSARGYMKILRVARTIADLSANPTVESEHVLEALTYREPIAFFSS